MCVKFLYFWGNVLTVLSLLFVSKSAHVNFVTFSQFPSPIIITVARTSALFLAGARLIFSEKHRGLAPFAWLLFSHEYITAVRLFPPLHSAVCNDITTKYLRNAQTGAASTVRCLRTLLFVYVKEAYSSLEYAFRRLRLLTLNTRIIADSLPS